MHGSWVSHASCLFSKPLDSLQSWWGSLLAWWHLKEVKGLNQTVPKGGEVGVRLLDTDEQLPGI